MKKTAFLTAGIFALAITCSVAKSNDTNTGNDKPTYGTVNTASDTTKMTKKQKRKMERKEVKKADSIERATGKLPDGTDRKGVGNNGTGGTGTGNGGNGGVGTGKKTGN
jgi:hypothetical protein